MLSDSTIIRTILPLDGAITRPITPLTANCTYSRHPAFSLRLKVEAMPPVIPLDGRKRSSVDTPTRIKSGPSEMRSQSLWRRSTFDPKGGINGTTFSAIKGYHRGHGFDHQPQAKCRMSNRQTAFSCHFDMNHDNLLIYRLILCQKRRMYNQDSAIQAYATRLQKLCDDRLDEANTLLKMLRLSAQSIFTPSSPSQCCT